MQCVKKSKSSKMRDTTFWPNTGDTVRLSAVKQLNMFIINLLEFRPIPISYRITTSNISWVVKINARQICILTSITKKSIRSAVCPSIVPGGQGINPYIKLIKRFNSHVKCHNRKSLEQSSVLISSGRVDYILHITYYMRPSSTRITV